MLDFGNIYTDLWKSLIGFESHKTRREVCGNITTPIMPRGEVWKVTEKRPEIFMDQLLQRHRIREELSGAVYHKYFVGILKTF